MTHTGWHAKEYNKFGAQTDPAAGIASDPDTASNENSEATGQSKHARTEQLRRKLRNAGRYRGPARAGTTATEPTPQLTRAAAKPGAAKSKDKRQLMFSMTLIPAVGMAMIGLFVLGYQGGRLAVDYMDRDGENPPQALLAQLPVPVPPPANNIATTVQPEPVAVTRVSEPATIAAASLTNQANASAALKAADAIPAAAAVEPETSEEPTLSHATKLVGEGHSLMSKGDILGARDLFTKGLKLGLPEAALALGRSYDPKYLAQLPSGNAEADVNVASSMYREWYRKSVAAGSIAAGAQVDKLIQPMNPQ